MFTKETMKLIAMLFVVAALYLYISDDDYHKKFDNQITYRV